MAKNILIYLKNNIYIYKTLILLSFISLLIQCNNPNSSSSMSQGKFLDKCSRLIDFDNKINPAPWKNELSYECKTSDGKCKGFAGAWLYKKRVEDEPYVNQSHQIFKHFETQNKIINWNGTDVFTKQEYKDIYGYLDFISYVQKTKQGQKEINETVYDPIQGIPVMRIYEKGVFSKPEIINILKKYLKPGKMIALSSRKHGIHGHAEAIYQSKKDNKIYYFDSNCDENECEVKTIEEAVEKYFISSDPSENKEYNENIDRDLREFKICVTDFCKTNTKFKNPLTHKIDNLINIFSDDEVISRKNDFFRDRKSDIIQFINSNSNLYSDFNAELDKTLRLQIKSLKLNDSNILQFLNSKLINDDRIKRLILDVYLSDKYDQHSPIHNLIIDALFNDNKEALLKFPFLSNSIEEFRNNYIDNYKKEVSYTNSLKIESVLDRNQDITVNLTQKGLFLTNYIDLETALNLVSLNDFSISSINQFIKNYKITEPKEKLLGDLYFQLLHSDIDNNININNIKYLLDKYHLNFGIDLNYHQLFKLHNNRLNKHVLENITSYPKDEDDFNKFLIAPSTINDVNNNTSIIKNYISSTKHLFRSTTEGITKQEFIKVAKFLIDNKNYLDITIEDIVKIFSMYVEDGFAPGVIIEHFKSSFRGHGFYKTVRKAISTMIKTGRIKNSFLLIQSLYENKEYAFGIDDIKEFRNIFITKAIIDNQKDSDSFAKEHFSKLKEMFEPSLVIQLHPSFSEKFDNILFNNLSSLDINKVSTDPIQAEKLIHMGSILDEVYKNVSLETVLKFLIRCEDLSLAKKYILNCKDEISPAITEGIELCIYQYLYTKTDCDKQYLKSIIELIHQRFDDSILIDILQNYCKVDSYPEEYNFIKDILLDNKFKSSNIDRQFITKHSSLLSLKDVLKFLKKTKSTSTEDIFQLTAGVKTVDSYSALSESLLDLLRFYLEENKDDLAMTLLKYLAVEYKVFLSDDDLQIFNNHENILSFVGKLDKYRLGDALATLDIDKVSSDSITSKKLDHLGSILDKEYKHTTLNTVLKFLIRCEDLSLAKKYILNCSNEINLEITKDIEYRLWRFLYIKTNCDKQYLKSIIELIHQRFGDSLLIDILKNYCIIDKYLEEYNFIRETLIERKFKSSNIDHQFITKHPSLLSLKDVLKFLKETKSTSSDEIIKLISKDLKNIDDYDSLRQPLISLLKIFLDNKETFLCNLLLRQLAMLHEVFLSKDDLQIFNDFEDILNFLPNLEKYRK